MNDNDKEIIEGIISDISLLKKRLEILNQMEQIIIRQGRTDDKS